MVVGENAHWSFLVRRLAPETGATREALSKERMVYWSLRHHLTSHPFSTSGIIHPKSSIRGVIIAFRLIVLSVRLPSSLMRRNVRNVYVEVQKIFHTPLVPSTISNRGSVSCFNMAITILIVANAQRITPVLPKDFYQKFEQLCIHSVRILRSIFLRRHDFRPLNVEAHLTFLYGSIIHIGRRIRADILVTVTASISCAECGKNSFQKLSL